MRYPALIILLIINFTFLSGQAKMGQELIEKFEKQDKNEYIIILKEKLNLDDVKFDVYTTKEKKGTQIFTMLKNHANKSQARIIEYLTSKKIPFQKFFIINAIKVTSNFEQLKYIYQMPEVEQLVDNEAYKMIPDLNENHETSWYSSEPEWGLQKIKADSVWLQGIKGKGVILGGQDTGFEWKVSPLKQKYNGYIDSTKVDHNYSWHDAIHKNSPNFVDSLLNPCGYSTKEPCDDNNHGTHTMGTMVGEDTANKIGVAPESKWIACRNMDRGWGQPSTYLECFEWLLAPTDLQGKNPDPKKAPHVINNSWYCSEQEGCNASNFKIMEDVVNTLKKAGIVVVVSAGNSGPNCGSVTGPPAFFEPSFSVGATDRNDVIAAFSSRGPVTIDSSFRIKPNVSAPGVGVRSVLRNGTFASFNGTSMAGPHVAGVVALMISSNPSLAGNVEIIEYIIEKTSTPITSMQSCNGILSTNIPNVTYGHGRVNALEAVRHAKAFTLFTDDKNKSLVSLNPNPVQNQLSIAINNENITSVNIRTLNGQLITTETFPNVISAEINTQSLTPNMYICIIQTNKGVYSAKFVKI